MIRQGFVALVFLSVAWQIVYCQNDSVAQYFTPQNILRFADHLYAQKEYLSAAAEYQRYALVTGTKNDSLSLTIGQCFLRGERTDLAVRQLSVLPADSPLSQEGKIWLSYSYFTQRKYDSSLASLQKNPEPEKSDERVRLLRSALVMAKGESYPLSAGTPDTTVWARQLLRLELVRSTTFSEKSPVTAAALSAVVPGLGKIYGGRTIDGIFSFLSCAVVGWQAYDGFSDDGVHSIKGWLLGTVGAAFYAGNIYGSAINITLENEMRQEQFTSELHGVVKAAFGL